MVIAAAGRPKMPPPVSNGSMTPRGADHPAGHLSQDAGKSADVPLLPRRHGPAPVTARFHAIEVACALFGVADVARAGGRIGQNAGGKPESFVNLAEPKTAQP